MKASTRRLTEKHVAYYQAAVDAGLASGFQEVQVEDILSDVKRRVGRSRKPDSVSDEKGDRGAS
jgi:hypothetical protein